MTTAAFRFIPASVARFIGERRTAATIGQKRDATWFEGVPLPGDVTASA